MRSRRFWLWPSHVCLGLLTSAAALSPAAAEQPQRGGAAPPQTRPAAAPAGPTTAEAFRVAPWATGNPRADAAVELLFRVLEDADAGAELRCRAADALGSFGGPGVAARMAQVLPGGFDGVTERVVMNLGRLRDPAALAALEALYLRDLPGQLATATGDAIARIKGVTTPSERIMRELREHMERRESERRRQEKQQGGELEGDNPDKR